MSFTGCMLASRSPYCEKSISSPRTTRGLQISEFRPNAIVSPRSFASAIDCLSQIRLWSSALRPSMVFTLMSGCFAVSASVCSTMSSAWLPML